VTVEDVLASLPPIADIAMAAPLVSAVDRHAVSRIAWDDFWTRDRTQEEWLVPPFLARGRGHSLYAPAKGGKSLFTLYVTARAAAGLAVLDHPGGAPVRTLYLDLEMTEDDVYERLVDMGMGPHVDLEPFAYHVLPSLAVLDSQAGGDEVLELARAHDADLVVVDTTSRVIGGEENSADTMRGFYRWTGGPLKAAGIAALRLDHAGKDLDRGQRGSSAKADDVDVVWRLTPRDGNRYDLQATHRRMGWVPQTTTIHQTADPLAFSVATDSWPAGTREAAERLDALDVPLDHGKTKARAALSAAGIKVSNEALAAGLRWRRTQAETLT